jgi:hypothetical protein
VTRPKIRHQVIEDYSDSEESIVFMSPCENLRSVVSGLTVFGVPHGLESV